MIFHFNFGDRQFKNPVSLTLTSGIKTNTRRALSGAVWSFKNTRRDKLSLSFENVVANHAITLASDLYEQVVWTPEFRIESAPTNTKYPSFKGLVRYESDQISVQLKNWKGVLTLDFEVVQDEDILD